MILNFLQVMEFKREAQGPLCFVRYESKHHTMSAVVVPIISTVKYLPTRCFFQTI